MRKVTKVSVKKMKNYKAPVLSGIVTEILQAKGKLELTGNVWRYRNSIIIIIINRTL